MRNGWPSFRPSIVLAAVCSAAVATGAFEHSAEQAQPSPSPGTSPFEYSQVHMGMTVRIRLYAAGETQAADAARAAFARVAVLDRMMSDYRDDSELRQVDRAGASGLAVSAELFEVLQRAIDVAGASGGAFDPSIGPLVAVWRGARSTRRLPDRAAIDAARARVGWQHVELDVSRRSVRLTRPGMRLDLGGVAKGYILQEALRTLRAKHVHRALVEAGGDIVVGDAPPGQAGWRIEASSADAAFRARVARLANAALSTSGPTMQFVEIGGVRYSHVVDPRTGLGSTDRVMAWVIADDGALADALSTALTVLGPQGAPVLLARYPRAYASVTRLEGR